MTIYYLKQNILWYKRGEQFWFDKENRLWYFDLINKPMMTLDSLQTAISTHFDDEGSEEYFGKIEL